MADIKDIAGLAGVIRYGVPWHGRIEGGTLYTGKLDALGAEVTRTWAQPTYPDCWLVQKAGMPDPYAADAAGKAADALNGHELTSWAILQRPGLVHGKTILSSGYAFAWMWIDEDGTPWSVSFKINSGTASGLGYRFDAEMVLRLRFVRFGELKPQDPDSAAAEHIYDITLAADALGQASPALTVNEQAGFFSLADVKPDGSQAILAVKSDVFPLGFCTVSLSTATGGAKQAALALLANRAQTLGAWTRSGSTRDALIPSACVYVGTPPDGYYESGGFQNIDETDITNNYTGRIVGYHYDAGLAPVAATLGLVNVITAYSEVNETFAPTSPSWTYTASYSETRTFAFSLAIGASSLTANATRAMTGSGSGSDTSCSNSRSTTYSGTSLTTAVVSSSDTACPMQTDPSYCGGGYDNTTPVSQPTESESALAMYSLQDVLDSEFSLRARDPIASLHEVIIGTLGVINSIGCIGVGASSTDVHTAYSGHYNKNPAPSGAVGYFSTAVSFT